MFSVKVDGIENYRKVGLSGKMQKKSLRFQTSVRKKQFNDIVHAEMFCSELQS